MVAGLLVTVGCGSNAGAPDFVAKSMDQADDPQTCAGCHPKHYQQWASRMHAYASADPLFVAPREGDFRLQPNSPALKLGFRHIDLSHVGP